MVRSSCILIAVGFVAVLRLEGTGGTVEAWAEPADRGRVAVVEAPKTVFANSELVLQYTCRDQLNVPWQAMLHGRAFARGVTDAGGGKFEIRLRTPELKDAVVLPMRVAAGDSALDFLLFGRDPLSGRRQWAESLRIELYDPLETTAAALDSIDLPYRRVTGLGALASVTDAIVIVGEGLSLGEHRGLDRALCQVARRGTPAIVLAPEAGELTIWDPVPRRLELRSPDAGPQIDARTVGDLNRRCGLRLAGSSDGTVLQITDQEQCYILGDFRFDDSRGRICCIGWGLLGQWETSPAPRFFFVRLLEIVSGGIDLSGGNET